MVKMTTLMVFTYLFNFFVLGFVFTVARWRLGKSIDILIAKNFTVQILQLQSELPGH